MKRKKRAGPARRKAKPAGPAVRNHPCSGPPAMPCMSSASAARHAPLFFFPFFYYLLFDVRAEAKLKNCRFLSLSLSVFFLICLYSPLAILFSAAVPQGSFGASFRAHLSRGEEFWPERGERREGEEDPGPSSSTRSPGGRVRRPRSLAFVARASLLAVSRTTPPPAPPWGSSLGSPRRVVAGGLPPALKSRVKKF